MKQNNVTREWHLIDAHDQSLGRIATKVADLLRGKNKPNFVYHQDVGDYVVVINAAKVRVTGKKLDQKVYYHHSGYPGGLHQKTLRTLLNERPEEVMRKAVSGMLPDNKLRQRWLRKLYIYRNSHHPHQAQFGGRDRRSEEKIEKTKEKKDAT
jgi:large subunit ribosomal protein L13